MFRSCVHLSMLHISAKFSEKLYGKNGKRQTLITRSKVAKDSGKRTDLDTLPTSYVLKNSTALIRTFARRHVFLCTHIKTRQMQMLTPMFLTTNVFLRVITNQ